METVLATRAPQAAFPVADGSHVAAARAGLGELMARQGFDETRAGRGNLVLTEAATNILKHAGEGTVLLRALERDGSCGVEVLALDRGPGIGDWGRSSVDGVSSTGTPGTGLGAMRRLASEFDAYSRKGLGTAVRMVVWARDTAAPTRRAFELGVACIALRGEPLCGDGWGVALREDGATLMVADGLGHGLHAFEAARSALDVLDRRPDEGAGQLLEAAHLALQATRGAALGIAHCDAQRGAIRYAAAGNIAAVIVAGPERHQMISHNGIAGHKMHSTRELEYPWPAGALLVMHSDGIGTQWDLEAYPGLGTRHPALVAGVLYRDFARARDDACVVVLRFQG